MTEITYGQWRRAFFQAIINARACAGLSLFHDINLDGEYTAAIRQAAVLLIAMPRDCRDECIRGIVGSDECLAILEITTKTP